MSPVRWLWRLLLVFALLAAVASCTTPPQRPPPDFVPPSEPWQEPPPTLTCAPCPTPAPPPRPAPRPQRAPAPAHQAHCKLVPPPERPKLNFAPPGFPVNRFGGGLTREDMSALTTYLRDIEAWSDDAYDRCHAP